MVPPSQGVIRRFREVVLGGRLRAASTGGAPNAPDVKAWLDAVLGFPLANNYGSTEAGLVMLSGRMVPGCAPATLETLGLRGQGLGPCTPVLAPEKLVHVGGEPLLEQNPPTKPAARTALLLPQLFVRILSLSARRMTASMMLALHQCWALRGSLC